MSRTKFEVKLAPRPLMLAAVLVGACAAPPVVATFQGIPTPVLISKVDRIGGKPVTPQGGVPVRANARSEKYDESTTTTTTTTTEQKAYTGSAGTAGGSSGGPAYSGTGSSGGSSGGPAYNGTGAGKPAPAYGGAKTSAALAQAGDNPEGHYKAPPRTGTVTTTDVNQYSSGFYSIYAQGPNLLSFQFLRDMSSRSASRGKPVMQPKDADIFLSKVKIRSFFYILTDEETVETTDANGVKSETTKTTVGIGDLNGIRVRGVAVPARK